MKKKAMGLLLVAVLMLTMVMPTYAATAFTDIEGKDCEKAVTVLSSLGLIEGRSETEFAPEANLTRAEMATILIRIMGSEGVAVAEDIFSDVTSSHWAYSNVAVAYKAGLVVGMGDGTFLPDSNVTHVQLVKMLICALGYDVQAEAQGGYPSGYYAKGAQLGMLNGIKAEMDADVTRGNMAMILYNTLDLPLFDQATYGAGADGSYVESSDTLLSRYMDIFVEEGTVTANYFTNIKTPERACGANEVAIDSVVFDAGETDVTDLLGMRVKVYYSGTSATDADTPVILMAEPLKSAKSFDFNSTQITDDTTIAKLVYETENSEETISIDDGATFVLNGKVVEEGVTAADITPALGTVTLVCNDGISADVVKVWAYNNYTVVSRDTNKKLVYVDGRETPFTIDPTDKTIKSQFITADGDAFEVAGVEKWNILSVAESDNVIKIVKSSASVNGKIAEKDDEKVIIDGAEYSVSGDMEIPDVNTTAKFYLDFMGNIADMDTNISTGLKYGYLAGAQYAKGIDGAASFKIFTQEGEMKTFAAATRVILNNQSRLNTEVIDYIPEKIKYTSAGVADGATLRQLVKYSVNDAGEINELATANDATYNINDYAGNAGFNMVLNLDHAGINTKTRIGSDGTPLTSKDAAATQYIHNLGLLGANMIVNASTRVFKIPAEGAADEEYKLIPPSEFPHRTNVPFVTAYDLTENYALQAMCWDAGASGSSGDKTAKYWSSMEVPHGLITTISKSLNADLEPEYNITLVDWSGNVQKVKAKETLVCGTKVANVEHPIINDKYEDEDGVMQDTGGIYVGKLREGDVIRFEKDVNGYLTVAAITYRASDPGLKDLAITAGGGMANPSATSVYIGGDLVSNGTVVRADANGIVCKTNLCSSTGDYLMTGGQKTEVTRVYPTPSKIMLYDSETREAKAITVNDIVQGDQYLNLWRTITPFIFWVIR